MQGINPPDLAKISRPASLDEQRKQTALLEQILVELRTIRQNTPELLDGDQLAEQLARARDTMDGG